VQQHLFTDRFVQKTGRARLQRPAFLFLAGPGAEENNGNQPAGFSQCSAAIQTVHSRHAHVEHQAGCLVHQISDWRNSSAEAKAFARRPDELRSLWVERRTETSSSTIETSGPSDIFSSHPSVSSSDQFFSCLHQ
jgi:hypothetical protein